MNQQQIARSRINDSPLQPRARQELLRDRISLGANALSRQEDKQGSGIADAIDIVAFHRAFISQAEPSYSLSQKYVRYTVTVLMV
jgi:hypothetical protein